MVNRRKKDLNSMILAIIGIILLNVLSSFSDYGSSAAQDRKWETITSSQTSHRYEQWLNQKTQPFLSPPYPCGRIIRKLSYL